jgi:hypothetical protein
MSEQLLEDMFGSPHGKEWGIVTLRYFNPVRGGRRTTMFLVEPCLNTN